MTNTVIVPAFYLQVVVSAVYYLGGDCIYTTCRVFSNKYGVVPTIYAGSDSVIKFSIPFYVQCLSKRVFTL